MVSLKQRRRRPSIATSSMSDIGFLLLIFIMLISLMNQRHEEHIEYSEAKQLEKTQAENNFEIWIQRDGTISVDNECVSLEILEALVVSATSENPDVRVHIIADKNTPYKFVDSAVGVLQTLQHRTVSFVVKEESGGV